MNGDDRGVRELADNAGFAEKASARFAASELRRKKFDGHRAIDERVVGANDTAVSAGAEGFLNLITADLHGTCSP